MISSVFPYQKKRLNVMGHEMAYVEIETGDPIVRLHGNPTSSYLWRNVLGVASPPICWGWATPTTCPIAAKLLSLCRAVLQALRSEGTTTRS